jgi:hypothetical protein
MLILLPLNLKARKLASWMGEAQALVTGEACCLFFLLLFFVVMRKNYVHAFTLLVLLQLRQRTSIQFADRCWNRAQTPIAP